MTRINVRSVSEFTDSMARSGSSFRPGFHDRQQWMFILPGTFGAAIDLPLAPGFSCTVFRLRSRKGIVVPVKVTNADRLVKIGVTTSGHLSFDVSGARRDYDYFSGQFFLSAYNGVTETQISVPEGADVEVLQLHMNLDTFRRVCETSALRIDDPLAQAVTRASSFPFKFASVASSELTVQAQRIIRGVFWSKTAALDTMKELAASLVACIMEHRRWPARVLSPRDIFQVVAARQRILSEYHAPPRVQELSHGVGMNEFKLKCGYRQAFGTTIGADYRTSRLEHAARLISSTELSITEIALEVGYSNLGDFGIYFRRFFGLTPSAYRREASGGDVPSGNEPEVST